MIFKALRTIVLISVVSYILSTTIAIVFISNGGQTSILIMAGYFFFTCILGLCSLTILFNTNEGVYENRIASLLSFILLPGIAGSILMSFPQSRGDFEFYLTHILTFMVVTLFFFFRFHAGKRDVD